MRNKYKLYPNPEWAQKGGPPETTIIHLALPILRQERRSRAYLRIGKTR